MKACGCAMWSGKVNMVLARCAVPVDNWAVSHGTRKLNAQRMQPVSEAHNGHRYTRAQAAISVRPTMTRSLAMTSSSSRDAPSRKRE